MVFVIVLFLMAFMTATKAVIKVVIMRATQCSKDAGGNQCHCYECHDMTVVITILIIIC